MSSNHGLRRARFTSICAAVVGLTLTFAPGAHAAPASQTAGHQKIVMRQNGPRVDAAAAGNLLWGGGPVEHNTKVFLVFWGSQWNSDRNGVQAYLQNFFSGLGNGSERWSNVMNQYTDNSGHASNANPVFAGSWVDSGVTAPTNGSATAISNEANRGAAHFGVSGANVDLFVVSPSGTHPDGFPNTGFCAWHDWNGRVAFTNMPYVLDAGSSCGANSVRSRLDGFSIVGGHEYAEAETDPQAGNGWVASDGEENGDLCAWRNLSAISSSTGSFAVQPTWSNAVRGCASAA